MTDQFKDLPCERTDCRLEQGMSSVTVLYSPQVWRRDGTRDNEDQNWARTDFTCLTCGNRLVRKWRGEDIQWQIQ